MSKGVVIHLDNDKKGVLEPSKHTFDQYNLELDYIICQTKDEFTEILEQNKDNIKALIFDLLSSEPSSAELHQKDAAFLENIHSSFSNFNIPIFVFSGYLQALEGKYENNGTVFKISKDEGAAVIFDKIKILFESGFINVFSPNGILYNQLFTDLNRSFTKQFKNNTQIESIIKSITDANEGESVARVQKVFQRIAVKSLLSSLLSPEIDTETGKIIPDFLNPVEHYVQRISPFEFWTGDIFTKKDNSYCCIIITPRCDFASKNLDDFLICDLKIGDFPDKISSKGKDQISKALNDNPLFSGYNRYIPPCPIFEGGKIELSKYKMINKTELSQNYNRVISLSDELTNEVLGKFGAYFFRSGINPWDQKESIEAVKRITEEKTTDQ